MTKREIEKELLGAVLLENGHFDTIARRLCPSDFSDGLHRRVFEAMLILKNRQYSIDPVTIVEEMSRQKTYDPVSCSAVTALVYGARSFKDINIPINALLEVNTLQATEPEWPEFIGQ